jgi:biopolymer transport protein TolR
MSMMTRHKRRKLKSEINVVPYIDVMLVLLIIFMVTAPLLSLSVDVDLPKSQARAVDSRKMDSRKDPVIVTVDAEGRYFLTVQGGKAEPLGGEELGARLAAFAAQNPDVPVFVAAPGTVEYQKVMDTMALVQAAGVPKVSLMSQPGGNAR